MDGEIISIARGRLAKAAPYLAPLFYRLVPTPEAGFDRPATDGVRFCYDPGWLRADFAAGGAGLCAALAHSTFHCLLGHVSGGWDPLAADLAAALLIDARLPGFCPCRDDGLFREAKRRLSGVRLDDIPGAVTASPFFARNEDALRGLLAVDGHGLWRAVPIAARRSGGGDGGWADARRRYPGANGSGGGRRAGRGAGDEVVRFTPGRVPSRAYGEALRRYAGSRENPREDPDSFQYGLYAYGLEVYGDMPLIEPAETREETRVDELAVVIDTSGSCVRELTARFLMETCALVSDESLFPRRFNLHVIQCDAEVRRDDAITCARDFKRYIENLDIIGGGGTDFTPAFRRIDRLIERGSFRRLPCALFFTDGRGVYPRVKPVYDVIFAGYAGSMDMIDAPAWVRRLTLDGPGERRRP